MGITLTGVSSDGLPGKPNWVDVMITGHANNTYQTILNITGKGVVHRISSTISTASASNFITIRITADGVQTSYKPSVASQARGIGYDQTLGKQGYIDSFSSIQFNSSLLVEIMQSTGGYTTTYASIDYSLF
jgi:hypothetical protein